MNSSIYIILNKFKNEHITEEEAVQLIEDIYNKFTPIFPQWPQITYTKPEIQKFEVTCDI